LIDTYCSNEAQIVGSSNDIDDAFEKINAFNPDVIFLDLKIGNRIGFELLELLQADHNIDIIIVTAYDNYAIEAFKFEVKNYLLKPVNFESLMLVVKKIQASKTTISIVKQLPKEKIFLPDRKGWNSFNLKEIYVLEAENVYTRIHLIDNKNELISKNLGHLHQNYLMNNPEFIRVHKSYIVNSNYITRINNAVKCTLSLSNNMEIPVSNNMKKEVIDLFI
jgi:two-component system LytT family response regulator